MLSFIYFYAYSFIRGKLVIRKEEIALKLENLPSPTPFPYPTKDRLPVRLSIKEELGAGFLAGVISRLASTPLSIITVRLQVEQEKAEDDDSTEEKPGIGSVVKRLYQEEGLFGFWKGATNLLPYLSTEQANLVSHRIPIHYPSLL